MTGTCSRGGGRVRRRLRRRERTRPPHDELSLRQRRHAPLSGLPDAASVRVQRDHAARVVRRHHTAGTPDAVRLGGALPHAEDVGLLRAQRRRSHRGGVHLSGRRGEGLGVLPRERARFRTGVDPRYRFTGGHTPRQAPRRCRADHDRSLARRRRLLRQHRAVSRHDAELSDARDPVPQPAPRTHERSPGSGSQPLGRHRVTRRIARDPGVLGDGRGGRCGSHARRRQRGRRARTSTFPRCRHNS